MRSEPLSAPAAVPASLSLTGLRRLFRDLPAPAPAMRAGFYQARFIGPWWLRWSGPLGVALGGLPGWQGKRFLSPDCATNVLARRGVQTECLHMHCSEGASPMDGRPSVQLHYGAQAPRPWCWVRDELRVLDSHHLLGMTVIDLPGLRGQAFPFLLQRQA